MVVIYCTVPLTKRQGRHLYAIRLFLVRRLGFDLTRFWGWMNGGVVRIIRVIGVDLLEITCWLQLTTVNRYEIDRPVVLLKIDSTPPALRIIPNWPTGFDFGVRHWEGWLNITWLYYYPFWVPRCGWGLVNITSRSSLLRACVCVRLTIAPFFFRDLRCHLRFCLTLCCRVFHPDAADVTDWLLDYRVGFPGNH